MKKLSVILMMFLLTALVTGCNNDAAPSTEAENTTNTESAATIAVTTDDVRTEASAEAIPARLRAESPEALNTLNRSLASESSTADYETAYGTVTYDVNGVKLTHALFTTIEEADAHPFVCYADDSCFPIQAEGRIPSVPSWPETATVNGYGTNRVSIKWINLCSSATLFATITVKPFSEAEMNDLLSEKAEILFKRLDLRSVVGLDDVFLGDLRDYLAGDWDGATRTVEIGDYTIMRTGYARVYHCKITDATKNEDIMTTVSIDYVGGLEVLPVMYDESNSTIVADSHGLVEQWSLLERQNVWHVPVHYGETIEYITDAPDANGQVARVSTYYEDGRVGDYQLMANGDVVTPQT